MGRTARHHGDARGLDRHAQVFDLRPCSLKVRQIGQCTFRLGHACPGPHRVLFVAGDGKAQRLKPPLRQIAIRLCPAERPSGIGDQTICLAPRQPGLFVGIGQVGQARCQRLMGLPRPVCPSRRALQRLFQFFQTVELLQPQRRRTGRVLGPSTIAIPAPQVPLGRYQPLARLQEGLKVLRIISIHEADLAHPAHQDVGDRHMLRQRGHTVGQWLISVIGRQDRPARGAVIFDLGGAQIIREGGTERLFKALLHLQPVKDLPALCRIPRHQFRQCSGFGAQGVHLAFGL
mmetsp:Transcript_28329/g.52840  ORF Transcript_28329/g.52840 Transcript_28329/m.52840 type:complete len:289 (-) Transcript_28329:125-991(-)